MVVQGSNGGLAMKFYDNTCYINYQNDNEEDGDNNEDEFDHEDDGYEDDVYKYEVDKDNIDTSYCKKSD